MNVGEIAGPIETSDAYHLITVTKGIETVTFEDAEQAILFQIQNDEKTRIMDELKNNAKVIYKDEEKKKEEKKPAAAEKAPEAAAAPAEATPEAKPEAAKDVKTAPAEAAKK